MKKYEVDKYLEEDNFNGSEEYAYMRPCSEGNWVEAEIAEEMLKALKRIESYLSAKPEVSELTLEYIRNIIAKAEEA